MWRNWNLHTLLVGMQNGQLWKSLATSQKGKRGITTWPRNSTHRHIPKKNENLYMSIYSSIIHNN